MLSEEDKRQNDLKIELTKLLFSYLSKRNLIIDAGLNLDDEHTKRNQLLSELVDKLIYTVRQALLSQLQPEEKVIEGMAKAIFKSWFTTGLVTWENLLPENRDKFMVTATNLYTHYVIPERQRGREEARAYTEDIIEIAIKAQGEYLPVDKTYSPIWTHGYKNVIELANQSLKGGTK